MPVTKIRRVDFYANDWLEGAIGLTHEERSVYITVCAAIYAVGGPVEVNHVRKFCPGHHFKRGFDGLVAKGKIWEIATESGPKVAARRTARELAAARRRTDQSLKNLHSNGLEKPAGVIFTHARGYPSLSNNKESLSSSSLPSSARAPGLSVGPDHARGNGGMRSIGDILGTPPPPPIPSDENLHAERQQQHARFLMARGSASELELYWSAQMSDNADDGRRMFDLVEARMISDGWPP